MKRPLIRNDRIWLRRVILVGLLVVAAIHLLLQVLQQRANDAVVAESDPHPVGLRAKPQEYQTGAMDGLPRLKFFRTPRALF